MAGSVQRRMLELQADRIEMVLAAHQAAGRVWGGVISPRVITFNLSPLMGTRLRKITQLSEEIAMALGVSYCRIYREEGTLKVEIPREDGRKVSLLELCRQVRPAVPGTAVLGVEKGGRTLMVRLSSPDVVHILVSGTTGSGKTELLRAVVASMAYLHRQSECQIVLVDPKGRGLRVFDGLPHLLYPPASTIPDAVAVITDTVIEMERRDRLGIDRPLVVVVVDELADLLMQGGEEVEKSLTRLVQRGRGAGVHVIAATQKPSAEVISSLLRSNFPMRIVGRVVNPADAYLAAGVGGTNAERLMGRGDMLAVLQGQVIRFQAAHIPEPAIRHLVQWLRSRYAGRAILDVPAIPDANDAIPMNSGGMR
ncbi:MAG: DNA translocase FtsK [Anaerolineae bacterium]|nr:DNA translocase FtsK [Anaerolineae bacterium]